MSYDCFTIDSSVTDEINGTYFTTHPFNEYNGDGVSLTDFFATLRSEYVSSGKKVLELRTYNNSGFNHVTQKQENEKEFGIEVEWVY